MRRVIAAVAGISVSLMLAACGGGGDSMTLEEYFEEFERIADEADARLDALGTPDLTDDVSFASSRDALATFYDDVAVRAEDAVDGFDSIDPPDGAAPEHAAFVSAIGEVPSVTYNYANRIRDAESEEAFQAAVANSGELQAASMRIADACNALQALADDNSIEVDLQCDE